MNKFWKRLISGKCFDKNPSFRDLITHQAKQLNKTAIENGRLASSEHLAELERLKRIADLSNELITKSTQQRWPLVIAFSITLGIVSMLLFLHVAKTEIELDLLVSQITFRSPVKQVLSNVVRVKSLGVSDIADLEIPKDMADGKTGIDKTSDIPNNLHFSLSQQPSCQGSITVDSIILPNNARVSIRQLTENRHALLSFNANGTMIQATVDGCVDFSAPTFPRRQIQFATPKAFVMTMGADDAGVDLILEAQSDSLFVPLIQAKDINLTRIERRLESDLMIVRRISTILSGKIYFEALHGKEHALRTAETLRFDQSVGELRSIELGEKYLRIQYRGDVSGMSTGSEKHPRSLMPTYLDWLKANHSLSLLWGSAAYLFGIMMSLLKWWKQS